MTSTDVLLLDIKLNCLYFKLLCLYRLQGFSEYSFLDELTDKISDLSQDVVFIGDININITVDIPIVIKYSNLLNNNGFLSLMNTPTRIVNSSKTCIDHTFVRNKNIDNFKSINFEYGITDHYLLGLKYEKKNFKDNPVCKANESMPDK